MEKNEFRAVIKHLFKEVDSIAAQRRVKGSSWRLCSCVEDRLFLDKRI